MMRQAGGIYRIQATRAQAVISVVVHLAELAAEVTLQPIRRYGFDASILFADILLLPQALSADLWLARARPAFVNCHSTMKIQEYAGKLITSVHCRRSAKPAKLDGQKLHDDVTLIGFAGAPWIAAMLR
jgi:uroporphyrinogen decarboxylase